MAQLAIAAAMIATSYAIDYFAAKKSKVSPVDKGRNDDIRIQGSDYGAMIPIVIGRARIAPEIVYSSGIRTVVTTTPGRSGGKGAPKPPTPATNNYQYFTDLMLQVCAGPLGVGIRKIWQGTNLVYNLDGAEGFRGYYEAESYSNILANGATIQASTIASGGQVVRIGTAFANACTFTNMDYQGTVNVTLQYISSSSRTVEVNVNNVVVATWTLPSTSGALGSYTGAITLPALGNFIRFQGASGTLDLDRIYVDPLDGSGGFDPEIDRTGLIDTTLTFPADRNDNRPYYNYRPATSGTGLTSATLGLANGRIRTYNGTTNQEIDQLLSTRLGAGAQGYRNRACIMLEELELVGGQVPQHTVEVDEGTRTVDVAVTKLFALVNIPSTKLDVTALSTIGFRGLVIAARSEIRPYIEALQIAYNFDFVEQDGKLKAVVRGTPVVTTIPQSDLRMHTPGSDPAKGPVSITRIEEKALPRLVTVQYLDPALSFKNNAQQATRHSGKTEDNETVILPLVLSSDEAQGIAQRLLYIRHMERKQFEWTTSWHYLHLVPTGLVDLQLTSVTHRVRITEMSFAMPGLIKFKGVAHDASIYTQTGVGARTGYERPVLETPANTQLWMGKMPPLRIEDNRFGYYWAGAPRGHGSWNGFQLFKEEVASSGVYSRIAGTDAPAMIGVVVGVLPSVADPTVTDTTSSLIVDFYYDDDSLQTRALADIQAAATLNRCAAGSGANIEIIQFANVTPQSASSPYVARYLFTTLLRGRNNTAGAVGTHTAGEPFIILNNAVQFRSESATANNTTCNFKGVSVGQAVTDTPATAFLLSRYPAPPASLTLVYDPVINRIRGSFPASVDNDIQHYEVYTTVGAVDTLYTKVGNALEFTYEPPANWNGAVYFKVKARNWSGVLSTTGVTANISPTALPGILSVQFSQAGTLRHYTIYTASLSSAQKALIAGYEVGIGSALITGDPTLVFYHDSSEVFDYDIALLSSKGTLRADHQVRCYDRFGNYGAWSGTIDYTTIVSSGGGEPAPVTTSTVTIDHTLSTKNMLVLHVVDNSDKPEDVAYTRVQMRAVGGSWPTTGTSQNVDGQITYRGAHRDLLVPKLLATQTVEVRVGIESVKGTVYYTPELTHVFWDDLHGAVSITPGAITSQTTIDYLPLTIAGADMRDTVLATPAYPLNVNQVLWDAYVYRDDGTIGLRVGNISTGTRTPDPGEWNFTVIKKKPTNPGIRANLVSHWRLNEASGTRYDLFGGNHLTDNNTVTQVDGKLGKAAEFTTANSETLSRASNSALQSGDIDFTFSGWVYLNSKTAHRMLISKMDNAARDEYLIYYRSTADRFALEVRLDNGTYLDVNADALGSPALSTWYFIIAWHDSVANTINIQVNGGTVNSQATGRSLAAASTSPFQLGGWGYNSNYQDGLIDSVSYWKRVLTSGERALLYNSGTGLDYPF